MESVCLEYTSGQNPVPSGVHPIRLIARRYLAGRQGISLVNTLTLISIGGVTVGTALLIVVLSVFNGFFALISGLLRSYDPDIRIESAEGAPFAWPDSMAARVAGQPEVVSAAPYLEGNVLLAHAGGRDKVVLMRGVEPAEFFRQVRISDDPGGSATDLGLRGRSPGILVGDQLRGALNLGVGDRVSLLSAAGVQRSLTAFSGPRYFTFDIRGFFYLHSLFEGSMVFVELEAAQRLLFQRDRVSGVDIGLTDPDAADAVRDRLQAVLGAGYSVKTWYDLQKPLYDVMRLEKWAAYFILTLIIVVAVLNIVGSLTMIVIQKRRDIGSLMAVGYSPADIRRIFLTQGLWIGGIGGGIGGALGLFLSWGQDRFGWVKLAGSENFIIQSYPVSIAWGDVTLVLVMAVLLCVLASLYPAAQAARTQPADALRNE